MKIALIVTHGAPYSEDRLVGVKRIVYYLAKGLQKKNHEVTIIATSDSESQKEHFKIMKTIPSAKALGISGFDPKSFYYATVHSSKAAENIGDFDIVHSHIDYAFLPFIKLINKPIVTTIHGTEFTADEQAVFKYYYDMFNTVGISKNSIKINTAHVKYNWQVYNGVDLDLFPFKEKFRQDYMFFMGRINPVKGVKEAISVAKALEKKLVIVGFKQLGKEDYYTSAMAEAHDSPLIDFKAEPIFDDHVKLPIYQNARLFLFPVQYEETFASTILEAMSCGTPVVTFARGSTTEQIIDGKTGFLVNPAENDKRGDWIIKKTGIEGMKEAVERIYTMPKDEYAAMRRQCRKHVEDTFSVEKMVDNYEKIYFNILNK